MIGVYLVLGEHIELKQCLLVHGQVVGCDYKKLEFVLRA